VLNRIARLPCLLMALLIGLQGSLAAGHALLLSATPRHQPFIVEICTSAGLQRVDLGGEGTPAGHGHAGFCPICCAQPLALPPAPIALAGPAEAPIAHRHAARDGRMPREAASPPYVSRAPPGLT
jgi:hypothetical protein